MASEVRIKLLLECTECKRRNYATEKNKRNTPNKLELRKYCPWCPGSKGGGVVGEGRRRSELK